MAKYGKWREILYHEGLVRWENHLAMETFHCHVWLLEGIFLGGLKMNGPPKTVSKSKYMIKKYVYERFLKQDFPRILQFPMIFPWFSNDFPRILPYFERDFPARVMWIPPSPRQLERGDCTEIPPGSCCLVLYYTIWYGIILTSYIIILYIVYFHVIHFIIYVMVYYIYTYVIYI